MISTGLRPVADEELVRSDTSTGFKFVTKTGAGHYQLKPTLVRGGGQSTLGTFQTARRAAEAWVRYVRDGYKPVSDVDVCQRKKRARNTPKVVEAGGGDDYHLRFCSRAGMRRYLALCELGNTHEDAYKETHDMREPACVPVPVPVPMPVENYTAPIMPPAPVAAHPFGPLRPLLFNTPPAPSGPMVE